MDVARVAAAALVAAVLTAGCSDDDPEPNLPDPTPSASTSAASGSTSSTVESPLSATETVQAWVDAENNALRTGSTEAIRRLAAPGCIGCDNFAIPIEEVYSNGGSYEGGLWSLVSTNLAEESASTAKVTAAIRIAGGRTTKSQGAEPVEYQPQSHLMTFELVYGGGEWWFSVVAFVS